MNKSNDNDGNPSASNVCLPVGLCQVMCGSDKQINIENARKAISDVAAKGAKVISLPECWNSPYATSSFPVYAEEIPDVGQSIEDAKKLDSPSVKFLLEIAKTKEIWLIGGSIPEKDGNKVYNTCMIVNPEGEIIGKHRKVHLFDINVPGKIVFKESDTLTGGSSPTIIETPYGLIGIGICYDVRFPELAALMRQRGCKFLFYPGAFNMTTGPAHWQLLMRSRALDNQCYVCAISPARNAGSEYQAWGHSLIVNPWGEVLEELDHTEGSIIRELEIPFIDEVRRNIPVSLQKRNDIYCLNDFTNDV